MEYKSIWSDIKREDSYSKLNENISCDVLIIGGGITGISTAYHLCDKDLKIVLVDRSIITNSTSAKNTGKITYLQGNIYTKIKNLYNLEKAKMYLNSQKEAIRLIDGIINKENINCDYQKQKSILFATSLKEKKLIQKEKELLTKMGIKVEEEKSPVYNISVNDTYYFHPVKYLLSLAKIISEKNVTIYENTLIRNIEEKDNFYLTSTKNYKIKSKYVVIATHYPFFLIPLFFPLKGYIEKSYLSASLVNNNNNNNNNYTSGITPNKGSISFRFHNTNNNNYFIYLNGTHKLMNKYNNRKNFNNLSNLLLKKNIIPNYMWSNCDIITNDYLPYIGKVKNNLFIGTGYNTWGITNGTIAGKIISDLILNNKNIYSDIFNPNRSTPLMSILTDVISSAKPYIENKIIKNKNYLKGRVLFTKIKGKDVGIYYDDNNKKHIVYNKCPHLKCNLIFNEIEKTWDCPCHSSRFDLDGFCIKGPSNYDITHKSNNP